MNVGQIKTVLNRLMIKRTAQSVLLGTNELLIVLPPHETRRISCPLSDSQRKILREADATIVNQAKTEYEERCRNAELRKQPKPSLIFQSYFSKVHKLRAVTVIPEILIFANEYRLKLIDEEIRNKNKERPDYPEL